MHVYSISSVEGGPAGHVVDRERVVVVVDNVIVVADDGVDDDDVQGKGVVRANALQEDLPRLDVEGDEIVPLPHVVPLQIHPE